MTSRSLTQRIIQGAAFLILRQGFAVFVGGAGMVLLTRLIGPANYGLYAAVLGVFTFLHTIAQWGVGTYLIRHEEEPKAALYHQASTLLLVLGLLFGALGIASLPALGMWMNLAGYESIAGPMFLCLPIVLAGAVPQARIERELNYRVLAGLEIIGTLVYYAVAIPLALIQAGAWAPVAGWLARQLGNTVLLFGAARYRPSFCWHWSEIQAMLGYGFSYSAANWIYQLKQLVNPLIVTRFVSVEAAGLVYLCVRLLDMLGFIRAAVWRLYIPALSRMQHDMDLFIRSTANGARIQVLLFGPLLIVFAVLGDWLVELLFGEIWLPVMEIYPLMATGYLVNAVFSIYASALFVLRHNWRVATFNLVHVLLFAATTFILVPHLGLISYGIGELTATLAFVLLLSYFSRLVGKPDFALGAFWCAAASLMLFWNELGPLSTLGVVMVVILPQTRRQVASYWREIRLLVRDELAGLTRRL